MREIEIKARVQDLSVVKDKLTMNGVKIGKSVKQRDVVYCLPGSVENHKDAIWMRIRTENDIKHILTLKRSVEGHLDSIEHETVIEDATQMMHILKEMGYILYSDLTKFRQKGKAGDTEVCLDEVEGLGCFIEAEMLVADDVDGNVVRDQLWNFFYGIGIKRDEEVFKGYDVLERESRRKS